MLQYGYTRKTCQEQMLYDSLCKRQPNSVCQMFSEQGNRESVFNGYKVSVLEDEKVQEMDGGDMHNSVNVLNATEQ